MIGVQGKAMHETLRNMTALYLIKDERFLLLYRMGGKVVNNVYTGSAGGHFEEHELNDPKSCVLRELKEELGIGESELKHLSLRYIVLRKVGEEVRQNYYFFADLPQMPENGLYSNEGTLKWVSFDAVHSLEMPFSAKYMLEHYLSIGRYNNMLYGGIAGKDCVYFTEME